MHPDNKEPIKLSRYSLTCFNDMTCAFASFESSAKDCTEAIRAFDGIFEISTTADEKTMRNFNLLTYPPLCKNRRVAWLALHAKTERKRRKNLKRCMKIVEDGVNDKT